MLLNFIMCTGAMKGFCGLDALNSLAASIHTLYKPLLLIKVTGLLEPIPTIIVQKMDYSMDRSITDLLHRDR